MPLVAVKTSLHLIDASSYHPLFAFFLLRRLPHPYKFKFGKKCIKIQMFA